jgi:phage-related baseplate assembly protein
MAIVDLNQLAAPDVVEELDYETILSERKATLVSLYPEDQQEAVARTLTLESEPLLSCCRKTPIGKLSGDSASTRPHVRSCWPMPPAQTSTR